MAAGGSQIANIYAVIPFPSALAMEHYTGALVSGVMKGQWQWPRSSSPCKRGSSSIWNILASRFRGNDGTSGKTFFNSLLNCRRHCLPEFLLYICHEFMLFFECLLHR